MGQSASASGSSRRRDASPATLKGKERAVEDDDVVVGDDLWVALEIAFGGNGWGGSRSRSASSCVVPRLTFRIAEEAAPRLHALTSPLAASSVSILFISSFFADYILVRASALGLVTKILENEGFAFAEADKAMEDELRGMRAREGEERAAGGGGAGGSGRSTRRSSRAEGALFDEDEEGLSDLVGSLVLSDAGSAGTAGGSARGGSSDRVAASRSSSFSLSRSNSLHLSATTAPLAPGTPTPRSPAPSSSMAPPLSLLPDELVCVGLSSAHEAQWRSKVVEALFYAERVLPRPQSGASPSSPSVPLSFSPFSTAAALPLSRQASLNRHRQRSLSRVRPGDALDNPAGESTATPRPPRPAPPSRRASTSLPTDLAHSPVPFVALTQTPDGTSLTADVRLLRRLFAAAAGPGAAGARGDGDEMVFATGEAGLAGLWEGEEGLRGWEEELEAMRTEEDEALTSGEEDEGCGTTSGESEGGGFVDKWEPVSPSVDPSAALPSTDEEEEDYDDDEDSDDADKSHTPSDRTLLKCLQLDLTNLGLGASPS